MNNWQRIISNFLRHIPYSEKEYQERIVSILISIGLGWDDENINQQLSLNLGSTQRVVPDIVLSIDGQPKIIIEVKANHHQQQEKDILQLISYMKQMEINTGIYFGEKVVVYYKELGSNKSPIELLELQLSLEDPNWEQFVVMFSRESFNSERIYSFYQERLRIINEESIASKYISELTSAKGVELVEEALKNHLLSLGVGHTAINHILGKIRVNIIPIDRTSVVRTPNVQPVVSSNKNIREGKAVYSINGEGEYGVGKLALKIVSKVSADNPELTYEDLKKIFNSWRVNIKKLDDIAAWKLTTNDNSKDTRWFEKYPITSNDGVLFAVSTQWGIFNIENIIKSGREQGLSIEQIR